MEHQAVFSNVDFAHNPILQGNAWFLNPKNQLRAIVEIA